MTDNKQSISNGIMSMNILSQRLSGSLKNTANNKSLSHLKHMIDKNKFNFHYPQEIVERCCFVLDKKGFTLPDVDKMMKRSLLNNVDLDRDQKVRVANQFKQDLFFYVKDLSLANVNEYITKVHQYSVFQNIKSTMSKLEDFDSQILGFKSKQHKIEKIYSSVRNQVKFKQYNQIVSMFVSSGIDRQTVSANQLLRLFYNVSRNDLWQLIIKLFEGVDIEASAPEIQKQLIARSCQILEDEYASKLPSDFASLEAFVKNEVLEKMGFGRNYTYYNKNGEPIWAMVYILMRAGRKNDIIQLTHGSEYSKFNQDFKSFMKTETKIYHMQNTYKDLFLEAVYAVLNRKSQRQFDILSSERDRLWFGLKTVSLSKSTSSNYTLADLQKEFDHKYDKNPSEQNYANLILSLSFNKTTQLNPYFDSDDSIHFLLFLHLLFADTENTFWKKNSRAEFYRKINSISQELIHKDLQLALDYTVLSIDNDHNPTMSVLNNISDLLVYSECVENFFGQPPRTDTQIQNRIQLALEPTKKQYQQFVSTTISKYYSISKNFLYTSKVYLDVLQNKDKSVEHILDILVKDVLGDSMITQQQARQISTLIDLIKTDKNLKQQYERLLEFTQFTKQIKDDILTDKPVHDKVFKNKYSLLKYNEKTISTLRSILLDLANADYLSIYLVFIYYFFRITEKFYSSKPERNQQLIEATASIRKHFYDLRENGICKRGGDDFQEKMNQLEKMFKS